MRPLGLCLLLGLMALLSSVQSSELRNKRQGDGGAGGLLTGGGGRNSSKEEMGLDLVVDPLAFEAVVDEVPSEGLVLDQRDYMEEGVMADSGL